MNKDNLVRLRDHLETIDPRKFRMEKFTSRSYFSIGTVDDANETNFCGTAACMIGHASTIFPFEKSDMKHGNIEWLDFSARVFDLPRKVGRLWWFLFGVCWVDSIPEAIRRINYVLENDGYPEDFEDWIQFGWRPKSDPKKFFKTRI